MGGGDEMDEEKPIVIHCDYVHGNGKQLIYIQCFSTRPHYYTINIDSKIDVDNQDVMSELVEDLLNEIEEQYGYHIEEMDDFPAVSSGCGYSWGIENQAH